MKKKQSIVGPLKCCGLFQKPSDGILVGKKDLFFRNKCKNTHTGLVIEDAKQPQGSQFTYQNVFAV